MKVAVCLFGNIGCHSCATTRTKNMILQDKTNDIINEYGNIDPKYGYINLKNKIFDKYDTDIFIHSWAHKHKNYINELYNPKKYIYEEQKIFDIDINKYGINQQEKNINNWNITDTAKYAYKRIFDTFNDYDYFIKECKLQIFRSSSRWYSTMKVLELKDLYEKENNIIYDWVILCRFDNTKDVCINSYNKLSNLNLNTIDNNKIYVENRINRPDKNYAYNDLLFLTNSINSNIYRTLFENRHNYTIHPIYSNREHLEKNINKEFIEYI